MLNKIHYGGSVNQKTGKIGPKPSGGNSFRKTKRFEDITRMELAGFTEQMTGAMLGLSVNRLRHIKKSPDYLIVRLRLTHGIILDSSSKLSEIKAQRREMLTQMLPAALQVVARQLTETPTNLAEKALQVRVAQDVLDREGTYAKISRTEVKPVDAFDFERTDAASTDIISAIRGVASPTDSERMVSAGTLERNKAFSNSETISAIDQQAALDELEATLELPPATETIQ